MERYDVVVVGVGGMGSAALYHLARRGKRVLGLERFDIPHELGSSHGITRIIRLGYFEHTALRAVAAARVRALARARDGGRRAAPARHRNASRRASRSSRARCARATSTTSRTRSSTAPRSTRRFPAYELPHDLPVLFQPDGGFVLPERCIVAHVAGALAHGAVVRARERVLDWTVGENGVRVVTDAGVVEAERLVLTAGAYSQEVARLPAGSVVAARQVPGLAPAAAARALRARPLSGLQPRSSTATTSTASRSSAIPGFKLGRYDYEGERGDPDTISREPTPEDEAPLRRFAERYFPQGAGPTLTLKTCLFELSPDEHFLIDRHPESEHAVVGAGFSGHGFKFCSVVGEILADLALDGETRHDIEFLRFARFA